MYHQISKLSQLLHLTKNENYIEIRGQFSKTYHLWIGRYYTQIVLT